MSADKYLSIFSRQMEDIVYIILCNFYRNKLKFTRLRRETCGYYSRNEANTLDIVELLIFQSGVTVLKLKRFVGMPH